MPNPRYVVCGNYYQFYRFGNEGRETLLRPPPAGRLAENGSIQIGVSAGMGVMFGLEGILNLWKHGDAAACRLVPLDSWSDGRPLSVHPPAVLGRSTNADVYLSDPWVSRVHCEITRRDGIFVLRDLESRHGVFLNEERVQQAILHPGDVLLVGVTRYRVEFETPPGM